MVATTILAELFTKIQGPKLGLLMEKGGVCSLGWLEVESG